ncbi:hypothetical protein APSETT444_009031 [Aspergillus pseudonomiae]
MKAITPFPLENLPYGVVSTPDDPTPRHPANVAMVELDPSSFSKPVLNVFASTPQSTQAEVRARLVRFLEGATEAHKEKYFIRLSQVTNHLPMETANFSDFYCSLEHAKNRLNGVGEKSGLACLLERALPENKLACMEIDSLEYLEDGDEVIMEGWCLHPETGRYFGFGECRAVIVPALDQRDM